MKPVIKIAIVIGIAIFFWYLNSSGFNKGDQIIMNTEQFGAISYYVTEEIAHAANHADQVAILQLIYDGKARMIPNGTKGTIISTKGSVIEVRFEDDPLANWWIPKEFITKL